MFDILAIIAGLLISPAAAQNVTCATRPVGDSSNACASTRFVKNTTPLNIISYGAISGQDASAAVQAALVDCGLQARPVYVPAGSWPITVTSNWPTGNNNCPGIYGDGPDASVFHLNDSNIAVITATVQAGIAQSGKFIHDLGVVGFWTSATPTYSSSRLINIIGAVDGWAYSKFVRLNVIGVHDGVRIATANATIAGGILQSNSGWNLFDSFFGNAGCGGGLACSALIYPDSFVNYASSTSTGNLFSNFIGATISGWIFAGGGAAVMTGDIVIHGGQSLGGRVLYIGGGSGNCGGYERNIVISDVDIDAQTLEVFKAECGFLPDVRISGSLAGTTPWAGINYLALSDIHDLGEGHWGAGGFISVGLTTGVHTAIPLWVVTLGTNQGSLAAGQGFTMTRLEVSVTGVVGGVGGGGAIAVYDCAVSSTTTECYEVTALGKRVAPGNGGALPAGWPVINAPVISGNRVTFTSTWTDATASVLISNIKADHGAIKVVHGANVF